MTSTAAVAALALANKLPTPAQNPERGADLNAKYRTALAALDTEIEASANRGRITPELLDRRSRVNRDWLAINRRKN
jgi:hypothetical protein